MSYKLNQIGLFTAINNEVCRQHPGLPAEPRLMNAVIAAADDLAAGFREAFRVLRPGSTLILSGMKPR